MSTIINIGRTIKKSFPGLAGFIDKIVMPIITYRNNKARLRRRELYNKNSLHVLREFNEAFKDVKIDYWLMYGTLIGAIREHNFLSHDADIDVGVLDTIDFDKLQKSLDKHGFTLSRRIDMYSRFVIAKGFELTYTKDFVSIDIFVFEDLGNNVIRTFDYSESRTEYRYMIYETVRQCTFPFKGLMDYDFLGIDTKVPINYDELLRANYGNYMIPDTHWDVDKDQAAKVVPNSIGIVRL